MTIECSWADEALRRIDCIITGAFSWDEFFAHLAELQTMLCGIDHDVYIIARIQSERFPTGNPLPRLHSLVDCLPPQVTALIFFSERPLICAPLYGFLERYHRLGGKRLHLVRYEQDLTHLLRRLAVVA